MSGMFKQLLLKKILLIVTIQLNRVLIGQLSYGKVYELSSLQFG